VPLSVAFMGGVMRLAVLVVFFLVAACAPRGDIVRVADIPPDAAPYDVFVATTRAPEPGLARFSTRRGTETSFARLTVSVPPAHETGQIEWPRGRKPDPARHFVTTAEERFSSAPAMVSALNARLDSLPPDERELVIFVHGFNVNYAEGLYRLVQMNHDLSIPGVALAFSWSSIAHPLGYVHDRDSVMIDRDALAELLRRAAATRARRVVVVAHSMGSFLTMEALRELGMRGDTATLGRLGGVILLSPDINIEVFRAQASRVQPFPDPFIVFSSRRDRALYLSARLAGERARLGSIDDVGSLQDLGVTVVDTTNYADRLSNNHSMVTSPALVSIFRNLVPYYVGLNTDQIDTTGLFPGTVRLVQGVTEIVLQPLTGQP